MSLAGISPIFIDSFMVHFPAIAMFPSKIEWDRIPTDPLNKLLELLDTQVQGVRSVGPVGDFLECLFTGV